MTRPALIWTNHATDRLGERFGTKSDKIKLAIEELLETNQFTVIPEEEPRPGCVRVRLNVRDCAVSLILAEAGKTHTKVITVLPAPKKRRRTKHWLRM